LVQLVQLAPMGQWVLEVQTDHWSLVGQQGQAVQEILQDLRNPADPGHLLFQEVLKVQVILKVQLDQAVLSHLRAQAVQKIPVVLPVLNLHLDLRVRPDQVVQTVLVNQEIQMIPCCQLLQLHPALLDHLDFLQVQLALLVRQLLEVQVNLDYLDLPDCQLVQDRQETLGFRASLINLRVLTAHSVH
jgi:hypothetical protein